MQDDTTPTVMPTNATVSNVSHGLFIGSPTLEKRSPHLPDSHPIFPRRRNRGKISPFRRPPLRPPDSQLCFAGADTGRKPVPKFLPG